MTERARVTIVLSASGMPMVELDGPEGRQREVTLYDLQDLVAILEAQAAGLRNIGSDGAPTGAQAYHYAKHSMFPDERCAFCRADRAIARAAEVESNADALRRGIRPLQRFVADGGVVVRRVPLGQSGLAPKAPKAKTPREAGPPAHFTKAQTQQWRADQAKRAAKAKRDLENLFG